MPAFNRRKRRLTIDNVTHLRLLRYNQPRPDDDDLEIVRPRRRGIYLPSNALTTAALFVDFFIIVQAMNLNFETAAIAIFTAIVLDGMGDRVTRITNTQSAFDEQYDPLSDMVSFGVAPALVMCEWILRDLGKWGWLVVFVYCVGAALRLARFNTNIGSVDKRFFQGMPNPAAAALIAGFVWLAVDNKLSVKELRTPWVAFRLMLYAGLSMVSNMPSYGGKALDVRHRVPFGVMVLVLALFVAISGDSSAALFGLFVGYAVSGYLLWDWRALHG